jgi:FlaA1/EpsC-like NDP-sugar epimerase
MHFPQPWLSSPEGMESREMPDSSARKGFSSGSIPLSMVPASIVNMKEGLLTRFSRLLLGRRAWFAGFLQALLVVFSFFGAWLMRFDFSLPYRWTFLLAVVILTAIRLPLFGYFGLFRGWWSYAGAKEGLEILKAVSIGSLVFWLVMRVALGVTLFPRSVYVLEALFTAGLLVGVRLLSRVFVESLRQDAAAARKVILIGAGFAAQTLLREIMREGSGMIAVGCVDDDVSKHGIRAHGVPVLGSVEDLPGIVSRMEVDEILIAVPSASGQQMQRFTAICEKTGLRFRTVPALRDILSGQVSIREFRDVHLEDLLGRNPVEIDLESVRRHIAGRVVLVTGAAGSIGSELCRQVLEFAPAKLICLDQSETGIFYLERELCQQQTEAQIIFCVADISDGYRMKHLFEEHHPAIVFHAAAYKHVPMMELNVQEAVKNNVFAFMDLLEIAGESHCESFVLISSDKAVNPTSVMGVTKRIDELVLACRPPNSMRCVSVRFGNVLGSNGSVVPVLQDQIRNGQPLTITHPEIKRFFMTTREAVSLVLQAFAIGNHGDILVLDMGEPVRILDLARTLIHLSGKTEEQVGICFTGLRKGEKLTEELFYPDEAVLPTLRQRVRRARGNLQGWPVLRKQLEELRASMTLDGAAPVRAKLMEIIPEFSPMQNESEISIEPMILSVKH